MRDCEKKLLLLGNEGPKEKTAGGCGQQNWRGGGEDYTNANGSETQGLKHLEVPQCQIISQSSYNSNGVSLRHSAFLPPLSPTPPIINILFLHVLIWNGVIYKKKKKVFIT